MANFPAIHVVQLIEPFDPDKRKREMNELEVKIRMAERYWAERKEQKK